MGSTTVVTERWKQKRNIKRGEVGDWGVEAKHLGDSKAVRARAGAMADGGKERQRHFNGSPGKQSDTVC